MSIFSNPEDKNGTRHPFLAREAERPRQLSEFLLPVLDHESDNNNNSLARRMHLRPDRPPPPPPAALRLSSLLLPLLERGKASPVTACGKRTATTTTKQSTNSGAAGSGRNRCSIRSRAQQRRHRSGASKGAIGKWSRRPWW